MTVVFLDGNLVDMQHLAVERSSKEGNYCVKLVSAVACCAALKSKALYTDLMYCFVVSNTIS